MIHQQSQGTASIFLRYEDLLKNYEVALVDNLRGFGLGKDIFDLWVPSDDIVRSLADLLFAAKESDAKKIGLSFDQSKITLQDKTYIKNMLNENYPSYEMFTSDGRVLLEVFGLFKVGESKVSAKKLVDRVAKLSNDKEMDRIQQKEDRPFVQPQIINNAYLQKFVLPSTLKVLHSIDESKVISVSSELDGLILKINVNPENGIIFSASYTGDRTSVTANISKILCELMIGLPLIEVANHGIMRLVDYLSYNNPNCFEDLKGIYLPEKAEEAFLFFGHLCRMLFSEFKELTNSTENNSYYDDKPASVWLESSYDNRLELLKSFFQSVDLVDEKIEVFAIEHDVRIVIDLPNPSGEKLFNIEKLIKKEVDSRLEVFLAEIQDKNKLRTSRLLKIGEKS